MERVVLPRDGIVEIAMHAWKIPEDSQNYRR